MSEAANTENDQLESLVGRAADEYTDRLHRGENVEIDEYVDRFPQIADVLRQILPNLGLIGRLGSLPKEAGCPPQSTRVVPEYLSDYRIVREIGRGGMGVVYEAEQKSLGRRVALKVLPFHRLMDPLHLKRFQREAQSAARLHHTNIVPVFGVGEHEGAHFYAMQYIAGHGLDQVIKELRTTRLASRDRASTANEIAFLSTQSFSLYCRRVARVGIQVAEALSYAHGQGLLHRDIKPSNLLLDAAGTVWVTDFGLAKAQSTEDLTNTGDLVGTLRYVAPERLGGRADARSDVFSLGLTLYELLTLRPAYDEKTQEGLVQQVTAADPPLPRKLDRRIPADLNTIVAKAIAKEPERRYQTASELAGDLLRFLEDRPIQARRTSRLELAWRWCRRNPAVAGLSAAFLIALLAGFGAVLWQWRSAETHRQIAESNFQKARTAVDECFTTVTQNPALQEPGMEGARQVLFRTALKYYQDFLSQRADDVGAKADLARAYYRLGYITERIGSKTEALAAYQQACALFDKLADLDPTDTKFRVELAQCYQSLGELERLTGRSDQAETELLKALQFREELARSHPSEPDFQNDLANTHQTLANLYRTTSRPARAEDSYRCALDIREQIVREFPAHDEYRKALAQDYSELARLHAASSKPIEAGAALARALEILEELVRNHPDSADYLDNLAKAHNYHGSLNLNSGNPPKSIESAYRKALGIRERLARDHPKVQEYQSELARVYNNLALHYYICSQDDKAAENYATALALRIQLAKKHPEVAAYQKAVAKTHHDLGLLFRRTGRWSDADRSFHEALTIEEQLLERHREISDFAIELAITLNNLGLLARDQSQQKASIEWYTRSIRELNEVLKTEPQQTDARRFLAQAHDGFASNLSDFGNHSDALTHWDLALEFARKDAIPGLRLSRASTIAHLGNYVEAIAEVDQLANKIPITTPWFSFARVYAAAASEVVRDPKLAAADQRRRAEEFVTRAMEFLVRGYEAGEFNTKVMVTLLKLDKEFGPLRTLPGFIQLLQKIDANNKQ